jgi:hypothetical protein
LKIFALKHVSQVNAASPRNASMKTEHLQIPTTIFFTTIPTTIKKTLELSFKKKTLEQTCQHHNPISPFDGIQERVSQLEPLLDRQQQLKYSPFCTIAYTFLHYKTIGSFHARSILDEAKSSGFFLLPPTSAWRRARKRKGSCQAKAGEGTRHRVQARRNCKLFYPIIARRNRSSRRGAARCSSSRHPPPPPSSPTKTTRAVILIAASSGSIAGGGLGRRGC